MSATVSKIASIKQGRASHFIICNSCYWCATDLSGGAGFENCPVCRQAIESIPLGAGEKCSYRQDERRGITLEFM